MRKYKYAGLIWCECGSKYRSLKEREKNKYVCLNYSKTRKCKRNIVAEEEIDWLIERHSSQSPVKKIMVYEDKIIIMYEDNSYSFMSYEKIVF